MAEQNPLYELYKELYFHEIDARESLDSRIQIPLAIIVSLVGSLVFMLFNFDGKADGHVPNFFLGFLSLSGASLALSVFLLIKSWFGHTYSFLPAAGDMDEYRKKLVNTYKDYASGEKLISKYLNVAICSYM